MATDVSPPPTGATEPSMTSLVSGIISDAERLLAQQLDMFKAELRKDMHEARETGTLLFLGGAVLGVASVLLLFMLVHLLYWLTNPPVPDSVEKFPLWACFGIVGAIVAVGGGIIFFRGRQKLEHLNPLPEKSAEALKENLQWKVNPK
jgi:hypothetical protein